ncbi:hypothetical protein FJ970_32460 (plasmid) [Mesorhizobium sp. B2-1-8]|uniref:hypothetical protein n=1 Tax=Mesorhizobium sp. B2-1-8 TaxID=2589967 RepID=UPI00112D20CC|nr:hypothetical protein [Mesorhizobium sp. B2-1-8]UCI22646.1 hypothetical protein FJ970_32460 [Mesorhizobium sp. B2-1-8]
MKISALPSKFSAPWGASAGPSYIRNIPLGSQIGITNGAASLADGFPPLNFLPVGSGGVPPFGQDMNGILRQITQWSQWQNAGGLVTYDASFSASIGGYPFGALLAGTTAGVVWLSTIDDNTPDPDTGGAHWNNIGAAPSTIMVGVDTGSANVVTANVVPVPSAYADGQVFIIQKMAADNNGAMTGNIESLGSHPIVNMDGTALTAKQWPASAAGILEYNSATTSFRLLNPAVTVALSVRFGNSSTSRKFGRRRRRVRAFRDAGRPAPSFCGVGRGPHAVRWLRPGFLCGRWELGISRQVRKMAASVLLVRMSQPPGRARLPRHPGRAHGRAQLSDFSHLTKPACESF